MPATFNAPLYIAWDSTLQCNARCVHCYSDSGPGVHHPGELTTAEALRMIDQLADSGLMTLAFSGGEPLLRKDLFQLIAHAVERKLVVNIASNGSLITSAMARRIKDAKVGSVTVSLDGASAGTHDAIRRFPGLFHRAVGAIAKLVREDLRVVVSFTPMLLNYREGPDVVRLAYGLGAAAVNMSEFVPAGRGTRDLALPPETLRDVVHQWIEMRRAYEGKIQIIWHDCRVALLVPPEERDRYSGCGAGRLTARIRVDGTLTPCVFLPNVAGNLRTSSFKEVWETSPLLKLIRNRDAIQNGNCGHCEYKHQCGGCRAVSMSHYGDPMQGDPSCWFVPEQERLQPTLGLIERALTPERGTAHASS